MYVQCTVVFGKDLKSISFRRFQIILTNDLKIESDFSVQESFLVLLTTSTFWLLFEILNIDVHSTLPKHSNGKV